MQEYLSQRMHLRTGRQTHEDKEHTLQQQQGEMQQMEHLFTGLQYLTGLHERRAGLALTGDSVLGSDLTGVCLAGLSLRGLDDLRGLEARGLGLTGEEDLQGLQQHGETQQRTQLLQGLQQQGAIQQIVQE